MLFQIYTAKGFCQLLMGMSVWLRSVNAWSTLFLSAFHLQTLKRVAPGATNGPRGAPKTLLMCLGLIWIGNLIYSIPAHIFSSNGNKNTTEVRGALPRTFQVVYFFLFVIMNSNFSNYFINQCFPCRYSIT